MLAFRLSLPVLQKKDFKHHVLEDSIEHSLSYTFKGNPKLTLTYISINSDMALYEKSAEVPEGNQRFFNVCIL